MLFNAQKTDMGEARLAPTDAPSKIYCRPLSTQAGRGRKNRVLGDKIPVVELTIYFRTSLHRSAPTRMTIWDGVEGRVMFDKEGW